MTLSQSTTDKIQNDLMTNLSFEKSLFLRRFSLFIINMFYRADGWIAVHFDTTLKQSAYLLAMVVCDYISIEATSDNGHVVRK